MRERLDQRRGALVVAARGDERRQVELAEPVDHVPLLQRAGDGVLVRPPHRLVDLRAELRARSRQHLRLRVEPADVAALELFLGLLVVEPGRQLGGQPQRLDRPARRARRRRVEDQARDSGRLREHVLEREHPAPRRAEQVDLARARARRGRSAPARRRSRPSRATGRRAARTRRCRAGRRTQPRRPCPASGASADSGPCDPPGPPCRQSSGSRPASSRSPKTK